MKRSPRTTMMTRDRRTYVCVQCGNVGEDRGYIRQGVVYVTCSICSRVINLGQAPGPGVPVVKG